jgi:hypothetical protein
MNRKQIILCIVLFSIFLGFFCIAVFAEHLGLDKNPGWGKGRYLMLGLAGFCILLIALIIWGGKIEAAANSKINRSKIIRLPHWIQRFLNPPLFITLPFSIILVLLASLSYRWFYTHGLMDPLPINGRYYPMLADAFRNGKLYLNTEPSPDLLKLENPYDSQQYLTVDSLHDASLFKGRYYLYWGPVPAIFASLLPAGLEISDVHLALFFGSGLALVGGLLLIFVWRRFFPSLSWWAVLPGLLILFWGTPLPFSILGSGIYETAIFSGQTFLILGLLFIFIGLSENKPRFGFLLLTGIFWALAAGSRVSLTPAILVLTSAALWRAWSISGSNHSIFYLCVILIGLPLGLGAAGLAWYNYARFGSILETGMCYALSVTDMRQVCSHIISPSYIPANAFIYFLRPPTIDSSFPFVFIKWIKESDFPFFIHPQPFYYYSEPVVGIVFGMPFSLFFAGVFSLQKRNAVSNSLQVVKYWAGAMLFAALLELIFLLFYFAPIQRYIIDFSILLTLSSMMRFWMLIQSFNKRPSLLVIIWVIAFLLLFWSLSIGVFSGISGTSRIFYETNPALFNILKSWFS